ncbi:MAG: WYL domain-containing protein [Proteobacteria bacterium]|nr:WYL domain-containing protein [Desulfobacteraceae bacterium]MBU4012945.1 WYL domain-containing protein [Pseudomonadota bacterium]MBU4066981.1 WYL domain-containing protein [Pseudomonadota bacterium]MBU4100429.1 WYL domain-containing protein [Pseudomonadota bacterium]MBU4127323.1 WYL domain-containing protein [Pseudomonadota bacterium]
MPFPVIPAKAGIQSFQAVADYLDSGFHRSDDFLRVHQTLLSYIAPSPRKVCSNSPKYDFEKIFNQDFGIIKEDTFKVEVEFTGWSAEYVAERIWSPDQKIIKKADGKIRLIFSSSSESELTGWALSFADEARVVKPKWLVKKVSQTIKRMEKVYS